jgi:hypothetical protein
MKGEFARVPQTAENGYPHWRIRRLLLALGVILCLGSLGHSAGVMRFYFQQGIPNLDRALLDVWIAEAQLLGGAFYLGAYGQFRSGKCGRTAAVCGALTVISFAVPLMATLAIHSPMVVQIPLAIYLLLSVLILVRIVAQPGNHTG